MKKFLCAMGLLWLLLALPGCLTDPKRTRSTLEASGFTEVEVLGYDGWACGEDDSYATRFRAKNPQGKTVEGVVCCGHYKGCTVRF